MSEVLGADLDKMDRLRSLFEGRADHLDSIRAQAGQSMASMASLWRGADMEQFVARWRSDHGPALHRAAEALREAAETVARNRRAQEEASSSLDGPRSNGGGIGGFFSDAWDATTGFAGDAWDATTGFASDAWDVTTDVVGEGAHRFSELGQYAWDSAGRRATNPLQTLIDGATLTSPLETLVATGSILLGGGEYDPTIGDGQFEAITGSAFHVDGAITLGHTVIFDVDHPSDPLIEHEQQHVYDVESIGAQNFYGTYIVNWVANGLSGQDWAPGGEAYENIWWEQRANHVQHTDAKPTHLTFDLDPRSWFS